MNNGWGDMSAALEFQEQVRQGDLRDERGRRGGRAAGRGGAHTTNSTRGNYHPMHMNTSVTDNFPRHRGRGGFTSAARNSPANTTGSAAGKWGAKLATEPPAHLFGSRHTDAGHSGPSTAPENRGDPMNVDEEHHSAEPGLGNSRWGAAAGLGSVATTTTTTPTGGMANATKPAKSTADTMTSGQPIGSQSGPAPHAVSTMPPPTNPGHGPGSSSCVQPISAAPHAPVCIAAGRPQATGISAANIDEAKPSGPQATRASADTPITATAQAPRNGESPTAMKQSEDIPITTVTPNPDASGPVGDKSDTLSSSTGVQKGLADSMWAGKQDQTKKSAVSCETTFGEDQGPVIDQNWLYTYSITDGERIYNVSANNARKAGDTVAELLLRNIANLCAGIVHARVKDRNPKAEDAALKAAQAASSAPQVTLAFTKYNPRVFPSEPTGLDTTYDSTAVPKTDGSDTRFVRTGESAVRSCAQSSTTVPRTTALAKPAAAANVIQPAFYGPVVASDTAGTQHGNSFPRTTHAVEITDRLTPRPVVDASPSNVARVGSTFESMQQPGPLQQSAPAQPPPTFEGSMPQDFDDPAARELFARFLSAGRQAQ